MNKIKINFYQHSNNSSSASQLMIPEDEITCIEYIDDDDNSTPMVLITEKEFDNLLNQTNLERIHCLLEKLSLLYESISNKEIAFDIACGKPSYDSQRAASDRVDKFQNVVVQIYDVLYNKE